VKDYGITLNWSTRHHLAAGSIGITDSTLSSSGPFGLIDVLKSEHPATESLEMIDSLRPDGTQRITFDHPRDAVVSTTRTINRWRWFDRRSITPPATCSSSSSVRASSVKYAFSLPSNLSASCSVMFSGPGWRDSPWPPWRPSP